MQRKRMAQRKKKGEDGYRKKHKQYKGEEKKAEHVAHITTDEIPLLLSLSFLVAQGGRGGYSCNSAK